MFYFFKILRDQEQTIRKGESSNAKVSHKAENI